MIDELKWFHVSKLLTEASKKIWKNRILKNNELQQCSAHKRDKFLRYSSVNTSSYDVQLSNLIGIVNRPSFQVKAQHKLKLLWLLQNIFLFIC